MPREAGQQDQRAARAARLPHLYGRLFDNVTVRTAYRCRAYPGEQQQQVLNRTFGCVRVVWNRTLAARHARWQTDRTSTSYAQTDAALTIMKKDPDLAFLNEVSSVPLQQALRHQHQAFTAFFARRARCPRFKSRCGRQAAHYTRSAFTLRGGQLRLAKTAGPLRFTWSWPEVDVTALDPTMVIVSREPAYRDLVRLRTVDRRGANEYGHIAGWPVSSPLRARRHGACRSAADDAPTARALWLRLHYRCPDLRKAVVISDNHIRTAARSADAQES